MTSRAPKHPAIDAQEAEKLKAERRAEALRPWNRLKWHRGMVERAFTVLEKSLPPQWSQPIRLLGLGKTESTEGALAPMEWEASYDALQAIDEFAAKYGRAGEWNLSDWEICQMAKRLAHGVGEMDSGAQSEEIQMDVAGRVDMLRLMLRMLGLQESAPLVGEPAIKRGMDESWWRRMLRKHVARTVEAGAVRLGLVNRMNGGYASDATVRSRLGQIERNQNALKQSLFKNEAGQIFTLAELSALSPSNPVIRGGELMTRIRGAEEYADARNHVGLFLTLTVPSRFHPVTLGAGGRPRPNKNYDGVSTPRDAQQWLRKMWQRVRAYLGRKKVNVKMYGIRVAEPHHDATPHWHALVWAECEAHAQIIEAAIRKWWLSEDGDERGAAKNRVNIKRMIGGGAAGYVAKYIAKSVGHAALADHLDVVQGQLWDVAQNEMPGHCRVDAWAACWGIRQFQAIGMPSVCVWRELRRVGKDQIDALRLDGDKTTWKAWGACHKHGEDIKADWRLFMEAMGGHCVGRRNWYLRIARRPIRNYEQAAAELKANPEKALKPLAGSVNQYGEIIKTGRVVGLQTLQGRWLISRRIAWRSIHAATEAFDPEKCTDSDSGKTLALGEARAALPRAWTGFNNCTQRLNGDTWRKLFGRGDHEAEDWTSPDSPDSVLYQPKTMAQRFQQAAHFFQTTH